MVTDESALRAPRGDREQAAADGKLELLGKRAMSDMGNDLGTVTDVVFDPVSGAIEALVAGANEQPGASLLGVGSYAAVLRVPDES
jgi:sporulation protein YlmC with PRC-barrel domain